jgi:hypothetical protein
MVYISYELNEMFGTSVTSSCSKKKYPYYSRSISYFLHCNVFLVIATPCLPWRFYEYMHLTAVLG